MQHKVLLTFFCILTLITIEAQEVTVLDSLILANRYEINFKDGQFSGAGIQYLLENTKNTQFVGVAENHNTKETSKFTSFLFDILKENHQFEYLALEQDPVMMRLLSQKKYEVRDMAVKYPNGFTFISDQELDLIHHVISTSKDNNNSVWGCDQSFGASHSLNEILLQLKKENYNSKPLENIFASILVKEQKRDLDDYHYMTELDNRKDLLAFKDVIDKRSNTDLDFYINSLLTSDSIYSQINKKKYFQSRSMREGYIRSRFIEEYKKALSVDTLPKVVLKFGHYHLMDGFNRGSKVTNVGNLTKAIAQYNEKETLIINTQIYRNDGSDWDYLEESYPNFTKHADINSWTLFDLRPLRAEYYNGALKKFVDKENRQDLIDLIFPFDMLLVIGNGGDGTWKVTGAEY